jgi:predicted nucleotidyltransferase
MRLNTDQIQAIRQAATVAFGQGTAVWLFGSRVDDAKKGGDIDLLFETPHPVGNRATALGQLYASLIGELGDRKIDVLLSDPDTPDAPVLRIARETGVVL